MVVALALAGAGAAVARASDAQVKAAVTREIAAIDVQRGVALTHALTGVRSSLASAAPSSAKGRSAKALAEQALAKASLAATEQVKSEQANTKMDYSVATSQTALATKNLAAAATLVNKAAALLGISRRAK
jgi:hypothetical protein